MQSGLPMSLETSVTGRSLQELVGEESQSFDNLTDSAADEQSEDSDKKTRRRLAQARLESGNNDIVFKRLYSLLQQAEFSKEESVSVLMQLADLIATDQYPRKRTKTVEDKLISQLLALSEDKRKALIDRIQSNESDQSDQSGLNF